MTPTFFRTLVGLACLFLLTSCGAVQAVAEFVGIATGDASPDEIADAADRNGDGVITGWLEWSYLLLAGGSAGAVKIARMMGMPIPKLDGVLDKVGLGRTAKQQRDDETLEQIRKDRERFDAERLANAIKVAERIERSMIEQGVRDDGEA